MSAAIDRTEALRPERVLGRSLEETDPEVHAAIGRELTRPGLVA